MYVISTAIVKLSVCVFLFRFALVRTVRKILYVVATVVTSFGISILFFVLFQCHPPSEFWRRAVQDNMSHGACLNTIIAVRLAYAHAAMLAVVDWTLALLPIAIVWNLHMTTSTKLYIALILGLGSM